MIQFRLQSEAALFTSDLKYRLCDQSSYKCDPGMKPDTTMIVLNEKLNSSVAFFRQKVKDLVE